MNATSLKLRMLVATALSLAAALVLIGALLVWILTHQLRAQVQVDLSHQLNQLAALVVPGRDPPLSLEGEMTDPRYDQPLGGLYWQIDSKGSTIARSRSLWDVRLAIDDAVEDKRRLRDVAGPGGSALLALVRNVDLRTPPEAAVPTPYRLVVAIDTQALNEARGAVVGALAKGLSAAFVALLLAGWLQIQYGLAPLRAVQREVERVRTGAAPLIAAADFPREVAPLAHDINQLILDQQQVAERARRRAADLAHGLKTPLAAIAAQADQLAVSGRTEVSAVLRTSVDVMHRHVERELALARSQGGRALLGNGVADIGAQLRDVVGLLKRLSGSGLLEWRIEGDIDRAAPLDRDDFDEVFGNLLDNARKWARSLIVVRVDALDDRLNIEVADDGPGIAEDQSEQVLRRGARLDEKIHGSGLGLSIAQTIVEAYDGRLVLTRSRLGGLAARVTVPTHDPANAEATRSMPQGSLQTDQPI